MRNVFVITVISSAFVLCAAQQTQAPRTTAATTASTAPVAATNGAVPAGTPAVPAASAPSSILQPSLDAVRQTLAGLRVEKWKRGSVRDEAGTDINSIVVDIQQRVPPLLKDADAAPGTLSKTLPVSRHVDALYDVLLRVVEASRMAAPDDQANQLRNALENLEKARLALDDSMESAAGSQEKQLVDLRVTVQRQAAFKCPVPPPPPACPKPPVKKPVRKKPSTGTTQGPAGGTTTQQTPAAQSPNGTQQKAPAGTTQQKSAASKPNTTTPKPQ